MSELLLDGLSRPWEIRQGDVLDRLREMPDESVNCCVTSPPYFGLRSYLPEGHPDKHRELGAEKTPEEYVAKMVEVFRQVRRVLRKDGTVWLSLGDSFAGSWGNQGRKAARGTQRPINGPMMQNLQPYPQKQSNTGKIPDGSDLKPKDLMGVPWMVAFALRADGWWLRSDIVWSKSNPMPESVRDRPTKSHEYIFLLSKSKRYYYDADAIKEDAQSDHASGNGFKRDARLSYRDENGARGNDAQWTDVGGKRNKRTVWNVATKPFKGAHFATFPVKLITPCILAGCPENGIVLDPFAGAATTMLAATQLGRRSIGIEMNPEYVALAESRLLAPPKVKKQARKKPLLFASNPMPTQPYTTHSLFA